MIDTVLFDFDGTLMDTNDVILDSWQETFRRLTGKEADRRLLLQTFGAPLEDAMRDFFPDVPLETSLTIYRDYQRTNYLSSIHLFPGIRELLDDLQNRKVQMALVTSRLKFTTQQALDAFELNRYFDCVVTADDVIRHKPDPQCIDVALEKLGARPDKTLMVGDSLYDVLCARNAGCGSVLVSWSVTMEEKLARGLSPEEAPDHIIHQAEELLGLL